MANNFVSVSSKASDPLYERDLQNPLIHNKLDNVDGNTQDFFEYVYSTEENLCIVATDFTGITTRPTDIIKLLNTNTSIKKVAIETFHTSNDVWAYDSEPIIADSKLLGDIFLDGLLIVSYATSVYFHVIQ
ncbi:hypothetical protein INT47_000750 [Mucor saturninus]|uniref:Uncharacterized protein n=1 Tax=Mucor saturninus TaxID=64648 RepID=A0A8H7V2B2_9FUNG|nr:hypothetical protein INT47_000750 [Mucor saturninus]